MEMVIFAMLAGGLIGAILTFVIPKGGGWIRLMIIAASTLISASTVIGMSMSRIETAEREKSYTKTMGDEDYVEQKLDTDVTYVKVDGQMLEVKAIVGVEGDMVEIETEKGQYIKVHGDTIKYAGQ